MCLEHEVQRYIREATMNERRQVLRMLLESMPQDEFYPILEEMMNENPTKIYKELPARSAPIHDNFDDEVPVRPSNKTQVNGTPKPAAAVVGHPNVPKSSSNSNVTKCKCI